MLARRASGVQASVPNLALEFTDSGNTYVDLGANTFFTGGTNRTCTAWVKPNGSTASGLIVALGYSGTNYAWRFRLDSRYLRVEIQGSNYVSSLLCPDGEWSFVACVLDGSQLKDHTIYLNTSSETTGSSTNPIQTTGSNAMIGTYEASNSASGTSCIDASLDDIRLYDTALSPTDLTTLYNNRGAAVVQTNLVGWWKFDEGTADTAATGTDSIIDSSSSGKHGTPYNSPYYRAV